MTRQKRNRNRGASGYGDHTSFDIERVADSRPSPAELAADSIDGPPGPMEPGGPQPPALVLYAAAIARLGKESPQLAAVLADEYRRALMLPPEVQRLYTPPSIRELARRAGVPASTARGIMQRAARG